MLALVGSALCLPLAAAAQTPPAEAATPSSSTMTYADGATSSGWIPFEYFGGSRILIPVTVNGQAVQALLDSGASATVVDREFASGLGLVAEGEHTGEGVGGSTQYGLVRGVELTVGALTWTGGEAVGIDLTAVARQLGRPLPIVLGGEMFTDTVVEIDFQNHRIAFHDPAAFTAPTDAASAPLTTVGDSLAIPVTVEGRTANLLFDLGNAGSVDLYPKFWEQPGFMGGRTTSTTFVGGVGGMSEQKIALLDQVALGGAVFRGVPTRLSDGATASDDRATPLDGNIGIGVLARFHLTVDRPHERVLFQSPVDTTTPFRINHVGLTLRPDPGGPVVLHAAQGSPAAAAALVAGDVILSIDGVPAADPAAAGWQFRPVGEVVRLELADGRTIILTLARYY